MSILFFQTPAPPSYVPGSAVPVLCEVAFDSPPGSEPVWTDISPYLLQFSTRRGRNMELDRNEAGTMQLLLDNRDRRFEPLYTPSPYYPNVVPMRRIRLRVRWDATSTIYDVFDGFVEEWPQTYAGWGNFGQVQVSCVDAFEVLNNAVFASDGTRPEELTSDRIQFVLDQIGWPSDRRNISVGKSVVQAYDFDSYNALQHLQEAADTENGVLFVDAAGQVVFQNRHDRLNVTAGGSTYGTGTYGTTLYGGAGFPTFGDADGELPYSDLTVDFSKTQIRNDIRVSYANDSSGTQVTAEDYASISEYLRRSYPVQPWLPIGSVEASDYATYLLSRYKDPALRIDSVTVDPLHSEDVWDAVFSRGPSDKVVVKRRPSGGTPISQTSFVESISVAGDRTNISVEWRVSPVDASAYWALGATGFSELDTTTRLAY